MRRSIRAAAMALSGCLAMTPAFASTDEIAALRAELARLAERVAALEAQNEVLREANAAPPVAARRSDEPGKFAFSGDFRYRYEAIDLDDAPESRERQRLRARFGFTARLAEDLETGVRIATGGDNPTSANATLGNDFSTKDLSLDRAWLRWRFADGADLLLGKMKLPAFRPGGNELIWDNDVSPEGIAVTWRRGPLRTTALAFALDERAIASDAFVYGLQGAWTMPVGRGAKLTGGVTWYDYTGLRGRRPPRLLGFGNTLDDDGNLVHDYDLAEGFAELEALLLDRPVVLFADYVRNVDADDDGYAVGALWGETDGAGAWELGYTWKDLEADAVYGPLTDSNFGAGGTDATGHEVTAAIGLGRRWTARATYFSDETRRFGPEVDHDRLQLDLQVRY